MKEATGELNMTVITVVAIAAIAGIFYAFVWPGIQKSIKTKTCEAQCPGGDISSCYKDCMKDKKDYLDNNPKTPSK